MSHRREPAGRGAPILEAITVTPTHGTIDPAQQVQLTAIAHYSGGIQLDVTTSATWTSVPPSTIVSVDQAGLVTGVAGGVAQVRARVGDVTGVAQVVVTGASADFVVFRRTISQPSDGDDFFVMLPAPLQSDIYGVARPTIVDGVIYAAFVAPDVDPGDRTDAGFRLQTTAPLPDGTVLELIVHPG